MTRIGFDNEKYLREQTEEILARQQINHKIPGYISDWNVRIAHKTGDDDGIVAAKQHVDHDDLSHCRPVQIHEQIQKPLHCSLSSYSD